MSAILQPIVNLFKFHKKKIAAVFFFAFVFTILLFPYDELSSVVTDQVAKATNNAVYLQFDSLDLALIPSPGVEVENLVVESKLFPGFKATSASVHPWILGAITGKRGGSATVAGLFGGSGDLSFKEGEALAQSQREQAVNVNMNALKLDEIVGVLPERFRNLPLQGVADISTDLVIDPLFTAMPRGKLNTKIKNFNLPTAALFPPGTMNLIPQIPELSFKNVNVDAEMGDNKVNLKNVTLGSKGDAMVANITGSLDLASTGGAVGVSNFDLVVDLLVESGFHARAKSDFNMLAVAATPKETAEGVRYRFRAKHVPGSPIPQFSPVQ